MNKLSRNPRPDQTKPEERLAVVRAVLVAGGGFASTIATILGAIGRWQLGDKPALCAFISLCILAAITMFLVAYVVRSPQ